MLTSPSGTSHDLLAANHVGRTERTCLTSLLAQGARHAQEVKAEVADRRAVDVLGLADVAADTALAEQADARAADKQQRMSEARTTGRLGHLARSVARTEERDDAHGAVSETAQQAVLERRHPVYTHIHTHSIVYCYTIHCGSKIIIFIITS